MRYNHYLEQMRGIRFGKEYLDYYVVYDMNDNIISFCNDLDELSNFLNKEKKILKFRFKTKDVVYVKVPNLIKIYKFS